MKLTVFGVTGGTGAEVVRQALDAGHQVHGVARRPEAVLGPAGTQLDRLTVSAGDVLDPASLDGVFTGADAVLSALGGRPGEFSAVYSRGTAAIVDAMRAAGVRRFVGIGAAPAVPRGEKTVLERLVIHPMLERAYGELYNDMRSMERLLAASELEWTLFHPPGLLDREGTGRHRIAVGHPIRRAWFLSRADLAAAMLTAVVDHTLIRRAVRIAA
ncbi:MAG: NAD(P)-dependent oxidoreductase [Pseudonocardiaceae bacterium]